VVVVSSYGQKRSDTPTSKFGLGRLLAAVSAASSLLLVTVREESEKIRAEKKGKKSNESSFSPSFCC
jgi:hypothetical protein